MPPAARITDNHVCPMVTGVVPHVGGPIIPPCEPTVLIGYLPAARITDKCICTGPLDVILKGSPTVLIGYLQAARIGDPTVHGGVIVTGEATVIIGDGGGGLAAPGAKRGAPNLPPNATGRLRPADPVPNASPPAARHHPTRVRQGTVAKSQNTMIKPGTDIGPDLEAIRSGQAMRDGPYYVVNDRYYGVHENGTIYPVQGAGLVPLDRGGFKALGIYNEMGETPHAEVILDRMGISAEQRQAARSLR